MTTIFDTDEDAIGMAAYYAGVLVEKITREEPKIEMIGFPHNVEVKTYEFVSSTGKKAKIGIGKFRDGYDLWLISPDGIAVRA